MLIGFAPHGALRLASFSLQAHWLTIPAWLFVPLTFLGQAWLLGYPLWAAAGSAVNYRVCRGFTCRICRNSMAPAFDPSTLPIASHRGMGCHFTARRCGDPDQWLGNGRRGPRVEQTGSQDYCCTEGLVCARLAEETCYRGMLYNKLRQTLPAVVAVVLTGQSA